MDPSESDGIMFMGKWTAIRPTQLIRRFYYKINICEKHSRNILLNIFIHFYAKYVFKELLQYQINIERDLHIDWSATGCLNMHRHRKVNLSGKK